MGCVFSFVSSFISSFFSSPPPPIMSPPPTPVPTLPDPTVPTLPIPIPPGSWDHLDMLGLDELYRRGDGGPAWAPRLVTNDYN